MSKKSHTTKLQIKYLENGFQCYFNCNPDAPLQSVLGAAYRYGITQVKQQLGINKDDLFARASASVYKPDGSLYLVKEWVEEHFVAIGTKEGKENQGLLSQLKKQKEFSEDLLQEGLTTIFNEGETSNKSALFKKGKQSYKRISMGRESLEKGLAVKEAIHNLEITSDEHTEEIQRQANEIQRQATEIERQATEIERQAKEIQRLQKSGDEQVKEIAAMKLHLSSLSGMELIMMRKMLETCRHKCEDILKDAGLELPPCWNDVLKSQTCVHVLKNAGLDIGLESTKFGKKSSQVMGSAAAHEITESVEAYATIICKMQGPQRMRMLNVFSFVFGCDAEELCFSQEF